MQTASQPMPRSSNRFLRDRPVEDVVYQIVTLAAILLVMGTLWVF